MRRAAFASLHFADTARRSHAVLSFPVIANAIQTPIVSLGVNHLTAAMQSHMRVSGKGRWYKYGNARLRRTLWMAGQTAVLKRTNSFRDKFERYISKDRHNAHLRRKAYTAIAAKMARTVHAVIKHGAPYRPFFEGVSPGGRTSL